MRFALFLLLLFIFLTCQGTSSEDLDLDGPVEVINSPSASGESISNSGESDNPYSASDEEDLGKAHSVDFEEEIDVGIKQTQKLSHCEISKTVAATHWHICALKEDQTLYCTGRDMTKDTKPRPPPPQVKFQSINGGWLNFCGVTLEGTIKCWGHSEAGHADVNDCYGATLDEAKIPKDKDFVKVSLNNCLACGLKKDGSLKCWKSATRNEVKNIVPPANVKFIDIATTHDGACGITTDGDIKCFGHGHNHGTIIQKAGSFVSIDMGHSNGIALRADGTVYVWGNNHHGVYGVPAGLRNVKEISMKWITACVLLMDNSLKCWGYNNVGQYTGLPTDNKYKSVFANYNVCYLSMDNKLKCTGHNADGQLAINNVKETWDNAGSTCPAPEFLQVGPGKCSDWQQHGPKQPVASLEECRDTCFTYSSETYFAIEEVNNDKFCVCYSDCDERTVVAGWTVFEVLSDKVAQMLLEKNVVLSKREDHVKACNARVDLCENRLAWVKHLEQTQTEQRWNKAQVKYPTPPETAAVEVESEVALADEMTPQPSCGRGNFMERFGFLIIGGVLGSLGMRMAIKNKEAEGMPLIDSI